MEIINDQGIRFEFDYMLEDGFTYSFTSAKLKSVSIPSGKLLDIMVPTMVEDNGRKVSVEAIHSRAFRDIECKELILPNSINHLGPKAFADMRAQKITIPDNVQVIPVHCFSNSYIEEIEFCNPEGIQIVKERAFFFTKGLKELTWPSGCMVIPEGCFENSSIEALKGIEHVTHIGDYAFQCADKLKKMCWPSRCERISSFCFHCSGLQVITGTQNVKQIGRSAFECADIDHADFPSVEEIEYCAFYNIHDLSSVILGNETSEELKLSYGAFSPSFKVNVGRYQSVELECSNVDNLSNIITGFDTTLQLKMTVFPEFDD